MRIRMGFIGTLINAKAEKAKNGNEYFKMSVDCSGEAGSISCVEDVYKSFQSGMLERFKDYKFTGVYNSQYGSLQIIDVSAPPK